MGISDRVIERSRQMIRSMGLSRFVEPAVRHFPVREGDFDQIGSLSNGIITFASTIATLFNSKDRHSDSLRLAFPKAVRCKSGESILVERRRSSASM